MVNRTLDETALGLAPDLKSRASNFSAGAAENLRFEAAYDTAARRKNQCPS